MQIRRKDNVMGNVTDCFKGKRALRGCKFEKQSPQRKGDNGGCIFYLRATCVSRLTSFERLFSRVPVRQSETGQFLPGWRGEEEAWSTLQGHSYVYNVCPMHKRHVQISWTASWPALVRIGFANVSLKRTTILAESGWANSLRGGEPVVERYSNVIRVQDIFPMAVRAW